MIFFENKPFDSCGTVVEFTASEDGKALGRCLLSLENDYAEVTELIFDNGFLVDIAEGLIKSAFNYAANKCFYMGRCSVENIDFLLKAMNFVRTENGYENDIPSILMGKCGSCGK
ncbi:MAG: hypothetical protein IKJ27_02030 [Clostridia bacterium]|nr:hypothetical protein [Clostridia bacterium]